MSAFLPCPRIHTRIAHLTCSPDGVFLLTRFTAEGTASETLTYSATQINDYLTFHGRVIRGEFGHTTHVAIPGGYIEFATAFNSYNACFYKFTLRNEAGQWTRPDYTPGHRIITTNQLDVSRMLQPVDRIRDIIGMTADELVRDTLSRNSRTIDYFIRAKERAPVPVSAPRSSSHHARAGHGGYNRAPRERNDRHRRRHRNRTWVNEAVANGFELGGLDQFFGTGSVTPTPTLPAYTPADAPAPFGDVDLATPTPEPETRAASPTPSFDQSAIGALDIRDAVEAVRPDKGKGRDISGLKFKKMKSGLPVVTDVEMSEAGTSATSSGSDTTTAQDEGVEDASGEASGGRV